MFPYNNNKRLMVFIFLTPQMFWFFLTLTLCEIFKFEYPGESIRITFSLDPENINTGFFKPEEGSNMKFKVKIASKDERKTLYLNDLLEEGVETHFSFNNTDSQDIYMLISSIGKEDGNGNGGEIQMKFESTADTFNKEVSKEVQYRPAINALNQLLDKLNQITQSTKDVYNRSGDLKNEQKKMLGFVVGFSVISVLAYGIFNGIQLYLMKSYLNEKKYL